MNEQKLIITTRKYKGESAVISARLPADMVKELDSIAKNTGRNRNEIVSLCLEYALENIEMD